MEYRQLLKKSLNIIKNARTYDKILPIIQNQQILEFKQLTSNIYFQLYAHTKLTRIKLQQWSFIRPKQLLKSVNCEEQQERQDPELLGIQIHRKQFLAILQNQSRNISPKLVFKLLNISNLQIIVKDSELDLVLFDGHGTFFIDICDYEGEDFECCLTLKYNYEYQSEQLEECEDSGQKSQQCEFQLLVDPIYEKAKMKEAQYRKLSVGLLEQDKDQRLSPLRQKKNSEIKKIMGLFAEISFQNINSSNLKEFVNRLNK